MDNLATLVQEFEGRVLHNEPLARYTMLGVGGVAEALVIASNREELVKAVMLARTGGHPWRVLAGCTNVLLPDAGLCGITILNQARAVQWDEGQHQVQADSGALIAPLARELVHQGWGGLTWAVGLPGTVGGAVVNNAGAFGGDIAGVLYSAEILGPDGIVRTVSPEWFEFAYRCSKLKGQRCGGVVVTATFQLHARDAVRLETKAAEYTERRQRTQPPGKTLGSTFKNPPGDYAGRLIEAASLKGRHVGGFAVSQQHANFFVNQEGGTASDFMELVRVVQEEVERQFGVRLELEIEVV